MSKGNREKEWKHDGLDCHIMKVIYESGTFHRCGYVTIPEGHNCFGIGYDDIPVEVHGGLTYSEYHDDRKKYTVGFDTAHAGDRSSNEHDRDGHFWTLEEMIKETNELAESLNKVTLQQIVEEKLRWMPDWFKKNVRITVETNGNEK